MTEDELIELREEYLRDQQEDRRYANRSGEEVLEDITEDFHERFGGLFEDAYNALRGELGDYGLESSTDEVFGDVIGDSTQYVSEYLQEVRALRKRIRGSVAQEDYDMVCRENAAFAEFLGHLYTQEEVSNISTGTPLTK